MKTQRVPFDIEKAKNGAKIVTRSGLSARRVDVDDVNNGHPVLCLVTWKNGIETPILYSIDGRYYPDHADDMDLFIEEKEVEETDDYNPYKIAIEVLANMVKLYSNADSDELKDFYNEVKAKCREAVEYDNIWNKKQNEQKTEIEPKFKVGDWIVQDNAGIYKVTEICESWYEVIDSYELHYSIDFDQESMCHLWSIQEARPGDVLAIGWKDEHGHDWQKIVIFKSLTEFSVEGYGNTFKNNELAFEDEVPFYSKTWSRFLHPATKEQRDLLFQKMKEAGYKWDSDKKELKKIESKFHKGDWVIDKQGIPHQITNVIENVTNHTYGYDTTGGYFTENVKGAKFWSIQEAKNGEVLTCHDCIVLFKEIDGLNIKCHCAYHFFYPPTFFVDTLQNKRAFYPATQEQCDLLYKKIKEEGYEWDADKKELHKIEKVKTRRMTNQELSWWLRDCPEEHREYSHEDGRYVQSGYYDYFSDDANVKVDDGILIRRNGGEWKKPIIQD